MKNVILAIALLFLIMIKTDAALTDEHSSLFIQGTSLQYYDLAAQIEKILENEKGTYGVFLIDLKSKKVLGINPLEEFHAASTFKLPLNVYLYRKIADSTINAKKRLLYLKKHYEGGTGFIQNKPLGSSYSIAELSKYSIVYSDNVATNILISYLGMRNIKRYMQEVGGIVVINNKNVTCPRDMALYMYDFLDFYNANPETADSLMKHLKDTVFKNRIPKLLPKDILIANKTGDWPLTHTYNDVAYIEHPVSPYIISIFSKNTSGRGRAYEIISKISKLAYDYQFQLMDVSLTIENYNRGQDIPIFLKSGRVWTAVREISEALDAEVEWRAEFGVISIIKPEIKVDIDIAEKMMYINDGKALAIELEIVNGKSMMPVRTICEALQADVIWDGNNKTVNVFKP